MLLSHSSSSLSKLFTIALSLGIGLACSDAGTKLGTGGGGGSGPNSMGGVGAGGFGATAGDQQGGAGGPGAPSNVVSGGACTQNSDCTDSPAARALAGVRCSGFEAYCLQGTCYADCAGSCTAVRTDLNPCPSGRLCSPQLRTCKIVPIRCQGPADCPIYLPSQQSDAGAWSCVDGICSYPGYDYSTK